MSKRSSETANDSTTIINATSEGNQQNDSSPAAHADFTGESAEHVRKMIRDIPIAMLTTLDRNGQLRSRPMAIQQVKGDDKLYLLTSEDSGKVLAIRTDQNVGVVCSDLNSSRYLSMSGRAQISQDRNKIRELWSPAMKAWFPDGPETPEICLLVIDVEDAEFWDAPLGKWVQLAKIAMAVLSGRRYDASPAEHGEVHIGAKH